MAAPTSSDLELLTEHFGYPPVSLIDDIINSINIVAERALTSVETALLNAPPATLGFKAAKKSAAENAPDPAEQARAEIESGTHQLETLLCASIDRNFDKFEIYVLRNIFCVTPPDVRNYIRLNHYDGLDFSSTTTNNNNTSSDADVHSDKPSLESIGTLRRKLRESMRLNALLHAEQERNARLLAEFRGLLGVKDDKVKDEESTTASDGDQPGGPFTFLHEGVARLKDAGADTPLSTTTAFTLSQLQALRALSTSLRTMSPHLAPPAEDEDDTGGDAGEGSGGKSWRRERLRYIEGATRRHLENVEGLELGSNGEVRDGEWQGEGRRLGRGEVEGLERVVATLGGEATDAAGDDDDDDDEEMDDS